MPKQTAARKMPPPFPPGEVLTDGVQKNQWKIGSSVGKGGFGEIYLAWRLGSSSVAPPQYVIKIEPHENGPLFSELSYYRRVAKEGSIKSWMESKNLKYMSIPRYIACGSHDFEGKKYRFMVMDRFGDNIETHFKAAGNRFRDDTICYLALRIIEGLEFLHESEYVHADIKGSNLLTDLSHPERVYLVDYGIAYRFNPGGQHKEYKADPRKAHDGTIEFTSIDAHDGALPSRRGDMEILGYCLLQWGCGKLPWEDRLSDKSYVGNKKRGYKSSAAKLVKDCFGSSGSHYLQKYMEEVYKLGYTEKPSYSKLKKIFEDKLHGRNAAKTLEWVASGSSKKPASDILASRPSKRPASDTPDGKSAPKKKALKIKAPSRPPPSVEGAALSKTTPQNRDDIIPDGVFPERFDNPQGCVAAGKKRKRLEKPSSSKDRIKETLGGSEKYAITAHARGSKARKSPGHTSTAQASPVRRSRRAVKRINYKESDASFGSVDSSFDQSNSSFQMIELDDSR